VSPLFWLSTPPSTVLVHRSQLVQNASNAGRSPTDGGRLGPAKRGHLIQHVAGKALRGSGVLCARSFRMSARVVARLSGAACAFAKERMAVMTE
jgi:hypothetical protein